MSDIWSLGCVFIEMFATFKGWKRTYVLENINPGGSQRYCKSQEGIANIITSLRGHCSDDEVILDTIEQMLLWPKENRPTAKELRDVFLANNRFCGVCCQDIDILQGHMPDAA
ncbi:hypothetical protein F4806DRAFT_469891 [Annulohypoxylon nitens]|nr:hypothetical protein F4806DRAFT_469891 [Annulohypoxylon nitens]